MNRQDSAETLAIEALAWLAEDRDRLGEFLAASGASPADLARQAGESAFLGAVLDHLLTSDALVIGFCDTRGLPYDAVMRARIQLPGGDLAHWT